MALYYHTQNTAKVAYSNKLDRKTTARPKNGAEGRGGVGTVSEEEQQGWRGHATSGQGASGELRQRQGWGP
jgi:hypothetical protein